MQNEVEEKPKLTTREKILVGVGVAAGVVVMIPVCRMKMANQKNTLMTNINADLRSMFDQGLVVGTGENADQILQYAKV